MKTLTTLIVADDHPIFLEGLIMLFDKLAWVDLLASATNGDEAFDIINSHQPDIALIDLSMSGASIEQIIQTVKTQKYPTQLIALTMLKDGYRAQQLLSVGLSGYVLKDNAFEDLLIAIEKVSIGESFISPSLLDEMQIQETIAIVPHLTDREVEVLICAVEGNTNKQIAYKLSITQRTVCFHMRNCFVKLEATNRTQAIVNAVSYGLVNIN